MKKISRKDLPRTNFAPTNIMYSLSKAIYNGKEGNWIDCGFECENDFINYLDALVAKKVIVLKTKPYSKTYNLANYIYIGNDSLNFNKKAMFLTWLSNNAVGLIGVALSFYKLFGGQ